MSSNKTTQGQTDKEYVYVSVDDETITPINSSLLILILFIVLYVFSPEVKDLVNPWLKQLHNFISKEVNKKELKSTTQTKQSEVKEEGKTINVDTLFVSDTSLGSRFIGMAEGNYILSNSGIYSNTSNYYGHEEPSGAVPRNTINRGFCSTPIITKSNTSKQQKVIAANNRCLVRLRKLTKEVVKGLNLNTSLSKVELNLILNAVDLGNQARSSVYKNMYNTQIPKALVSGKELSLVDITKMRRDAFQNKSALDTIPALVKLSQRYCGNTLEVNVITVDQSRRVIAANKALNNIGMGLPTQTRESIMSELCIRRTN